MWLKYTHIFDSAAHASLGLILLAQCNEIFILLLQGAPSF